MTLEIIAKKNQIGKLCAVALALLGAGPAALAATDVWTGGGDGVNWSSANNWSAHVVPSAYDTLIFQGSTGTSPNNDLAAATNTSITFSNNASAFALSGNAVTLSHANAATMIGITNSSANTQTIGLNLNLDWGNYIFASGSGTLALNGQLTALPGSVAFLSTANLTTTSLITDSSGLISGLGGAGLIYSGNTFAGLATVSGGAVTLYSGGTQISSGSVGDTSQAGSGNWVLAAAPAASTRVTYTLSGGAGNTYANTIWANGSYGNSSASATIQIGVSTNAGQLILGSAAENWVGGIYVSVPNTTFQKLLEVTNQFLTAGPDSGAPTPGTIVVAVNGGSGSGVNIFAAITNNPSGGAVSVIKTGSGGFFYGPLGARAAYTGGTYVNQGYMQLSGSSSAISAGPYYIATNASMYIRANLTNDISITPGSGDTAAGYAGALKLDGVTASGKLTLLGAPVSLFSGDRITPNGSPTLSGRITGTGTLEMYNNNSTWTLTLNNSSATVTNDWTGGLLINGVSLNSTVALGSANQLNGNNVTFNTGTSGQRTLNLNGKNDMIGALITTNASLTTICVVTNGATTACTLTLGANNVSGTFNGILGDGGSSRALNLVKIGTGTQTFGGNLIYSGTTVINGGTLAFPLAAAFPTLSSSITINSNAFLDISAITPLTVSTLNMSNGTVLIGLAAGPLTTTNLSSLGSSNYVKLTTLPPVSAYPAQIRVVAYTNLTAGALNFGLAGLPSVAAGTPYAGYISNNVANNSVDLVLTAGPVGIIWSGANSSAWDTGTANWLTVGGSSTTYANGENVTFPDGVSAKSVTLSQSVTPLSMVVSNTGATAYTFSDGGSVYPIAAAGSLTKQGAGTLIFDNAATNTFPGGVTIAAGTLQIGNTDANGSLATTAINDNSSLVIARTDTTTFGSSIQGTGGVTIQGGGTITLSGANSFTNTTQVNGNTILKAGNNAALGSAVGPTTISSGSTLDVNGYNLGAENVQVVGTGTSGQGAIDNSGASQLNALSSIMLAGDTTIGASANRWDLRSPVSGSTNALLSTGGHAYNLTKIGGQAVLLVDAFVDPTLANVDIQNGTLGLQGVTTGLGNPANTVTVESGATLFTYALTTPLNKNISLAGTLQHANSSATISGPIALSGGSSQVEVAPGTTLNLNGVISGGNGLTMITYPGSTTGSGTLNFNATNTFTGGLNIYQGTVNLNGNNIATTGGANLYGGALSVNSILGGSLTSYITTTLGGTGTVLGSTYVDGAFNPGASANTAGTFIAGNGMTFDIDATLTFDLATVNTIGSGINDYLIVTNDLNVNGNVVTINLLAGSLQPGTYHLISYTGNLNGSFAGVQTASSISQLLTLDTSIPGQVNLIVTGTPDILKWISQTTNNWDNAATSTNWLSLGGNTNAPFNGGNYVLFDDTPNVVTNINIASGVIVLPAGMTNNSITNNFTISGAGTIGGGGKLVKLGSSTLRLATANDVSGVIVAGGILNLANASALGRTNIPTVITNGGTLDIGGLNIGKYPVVISGAGVGGNGAIISSSNSISQSTALLNITMAADATIGGVGRWDLRSTSTPPTNAVLSTKGQPYNLTKVGTNEIWLVDATLDPALAGINVMGGKLGIEAYTTAGNPTNTITVYSNAILAFYQMTNTLLKPLVLNDGAVLENDASFTNVVGSRISLSGNNYFTGNGSALNLTNVISGSGSLIKTNTTLLILSASNTYSGNTTIYGGNLLLSGNGSIASSATITLNNATLDASGRADKALSLTSGQMLKTSPNGTVNGSLTNGFGATVSPGGVGVRGALTVTNTVTLLGTTSMELDETAHTNDLITSTGGVTYGGTLNVSVITGTLAGGENYKLFNAGSYNGNFSATNLPSLNSGLGWQWNPANGTLSVIQTVNLTPTNLVVSVSGNQIVLSWPADHIGWLVQAQTNNVSTGLGNNWVTIPGSDTVNAITNTINPANGSVFYRMIH
jgi:autotransporter-associated beta strand protein